VIDYCNWLSEREGLQKCYARSNRQKSGFFNKIFSKEEEYIIYNFKSNGYRLPTEAEWEYAARGGNKSKGYKYSGSDNLDEVAWYWENSNRQTHEVGRKKPNELALYDMSGNVWEWVWDWYGAYSSGSQTNPTGPVNGSYRGLRGGSWSDFSEYCRVAFRDGYGYPIYGSDFSGFRLLRTIL
jgi:formylglycine-generating enzyme required for sulfatase activity